MKILVIRTNNLTSLEGTFEIDFTKEPLLSAGIFAITGATGAGKSTLLDSVCLALFAKTPRYRWASEKGVYIKNSEKQALAQGDVKNILRRGTAKGFAEVEFIGIDKVRYRATWSVRRAGDKLGGKLQDATLELINVATAVRYAGKKEETGKEIERLVGLNFEQFTRSVLLAQGDFTAFMKANQDEKASLLEQLTGTEIYSEISKRIFEKHKAAKEEYEVLKKEVQGIEVLDDEAYKALLAKKNEVSRTFDDVEVEKEKTRAALHWYDRFEELKNEQIDTQKRLQDAQNVQENAFETIKKLETVEAVQKIKPSFEKRNELKNIYERRLKEKKESIIFLKELQKRFSDEDTALKQAESVFEDAKNNLKQAQPDIQKATELDSLIKEKAKDVQKAEKEYHEIKEAYQDLQQNLIQKQQEKEKIEADIQELSKWIYENNTNKVVAENFNLIVSELKNAKKYIKEKEKIILKINENRKNIEKVIIKKNSCQQVISQKSAILKKCQGAFEQQTAQLKTLDIDAIKAKINFLTTENEKLTTVKNIWKIFFETQTIQLENLRKLELLNKNLEENKIALKTEEKSFNIAKIRKEETEKMVSKAALATTESVEKLRLQLENQEPCPVCGSTEHPYYTEHPQLRQILDDLAVQNAENTILYEKSLQRFAGLEKESNILEQSLVALKEEVDKKDSKLKEFTQKWQAATPPTVLEEIKDAQKEQWLDDEQESIKSKIKGLQENSEAYEKLKKDSNIQEKQLLEQEKQLSEAKNDFQNCIVEQENTQKEENRLKGDFEKYKNDANEVLEKLNGFFQDENWQKNWQKSAENFEEDIRKITESWFEKTDSLQDKQSKSEMLNADTQVFMSRVQTAQKDLNKKQSNFEELLEILQNLKTQRQAIFEGQEVEAFKQKLENSVENTQNHHKNLKDSLNNLNIRLAEENTRNKQIEAFCQTLEIELQVKNDEIVTWLEAYQQHNNTIFGEDVLYKYLEYDLDWIKQEQEKIQKINADVLLNKSVLEAIGNKISSFYLTKISDKERSELEKMQEELDASSKKLTKEINSFDVVLASDAQKREQIKNKTDKIAEKGKIFENWAKLNELVGSGDGKKFRQFAQEYALDILLNDANTQLAFLSDRYMLARIPHTLGLQVLDKYMGDEIRSVHSLSGGESFLVSLALALGLSSFSSNKMTVESLFIDEGFGSLDADTLGIAMDALERLYGQGRKVGVISHVEAMTERIPTQIRIYKNTNGKSRLEIVSGRY